MNANNRYKKNENPHELIVARFRDEQHQAYHKILMDNRFSYRIGPDLMVGLRYRHTIKPVIVVLKDDEDCLGYYCENLNGVMYYKEHFTVTEWNFIYDRNINPQESLSRELYILLQVRPNSLNNLAAISNKDRT